MAKVLIISSDLGSRISASAELARRLSERGHQAVVGSPEDIGDRIRVQGVEYLQLPGTAGRAPLAAAGGRSRLSRLFGSVLGGRSNRERRRARVEALRLGDFISSLADFEPDLVMVDIELPAQVMAADASPFPAAAWTTMLSLWRRPDVPPANTPVIPGRGWIGSRLGLEFTWVRFLIWKYFRFLKLRLTQGGEDQLSVLAAAAETVGYPFSEGADRNDWLIPITFRNLPTLVFNSFAIDFPHVPRPWVHHVGPVINTFRRSVEGEESDDVATRLETIYREREDGSIESLIYCGFGAWIKGDGASLYRRIIAAVAERPEWHLVIGLGGRFDPGEMGDIPVNVDVFAWAPQTEVMEHSDVAILHGGMNSINEAIVAGVPMINYPLGPLDPQGNSARVEFHSLGEVGDRHADTPAKIGWRIERILDEGAYQQGVEAMRLIYREEIASNLAVRSVESLLES